MSINPRIFGAVLAGIGLVALSYYLAPNVTPAQTSEPALSVVSGTAPNREYIKITDSNNNGIPDWKEVYTSTDPFELKNIANSTYTPPSTLTDQVGLDFFERKLRAQTSGVFGEDDKTIVQESVSSLAKQVEDKLYTKTDITIIPDNTGNQTLERNYFNNVADILDNNTSVKTENEGIILQNALMENDPSQLDALAVNEKVYKGLRDQLLSLPVPEPYVQLQLDLINVSNAIYQDILGMEKAYTDPLYTLLRIKRYQDDATGLFYALQHYYEAIEKSPVLFTETDSATIFLIFKPK